VSRQICFRDLDPLGDRLLTKFCMALCIKYGSIDNAWKQILHNCGGNIHRHMFINVCHDLGIGLKPAKWLFAVLDPYHVRYLSPYDKLTFLSLWDPGQITGMSLADLNRSPSRRSVPDDDAFDLTAVEGWIEGEQNPFYVSHTNPYEIILELTKEEHTELQRRRRVRALIAGVDIDAENKTRMRREREAQQELDDLMAEEGHEDYMAKMFGNPKPETEVKTPKEMNRSASTPSLKKSNSKRNLTPPRSR